MEEIQNEIDRVRKNISVMEAALAAETKKLEFLIDEMRKLCRHDWCRIINGPNNDDRWWKCTKCGETN